MPKSRDNKQPQFLRFRPYHAFTGTERRPERSATALWWSIFGASAAIAGIAYVLMRVR